MADAPDKRSSAGLFRARRGPRNPGRPTLQQLMDEDSDDDVRGSIGTQATEVTTTGDSTTRKPLFRGATRPRAQSTAVGGMEESEEGDEEEDEVDLSLLNLRPKSKGKSAPAAKAATTDVQEPVQPRARKSFFSSSKLTSTTSKEKKEPAPVRAKPKKVVEQISALSEVDALTASLKLTQGSKRQQPSLKASNEQRKADSTVNLNALTSDIFSSYGVESGLSAKKIEYLASLMRIDSYGGSVNGRSLDYPVLNYEPSSQHPTNCLEEDGSTTVVPKIPTGETVDEDFKLPDTQTILSQLEKMQMDIIDNSDSVESMINKELRPRKRDLEHEQSLARTKISKLTDKFNIYQEVLSQRNQ